MPLALIRRLIKGTPLTAAEHDGNLNVLEAAIAASLQPGQAIPSDVECRNTRGVGLTAGAPVYIVSSSGTKPTVALADASSEATAARSLGLVVATVGNNADCMVRTHGVLTGVNTATLTEGAAVWLSETTGQLTSTRPTQPAHGVFFGFCVKQAAGTAGIIYINVINGQELDELHDVLISSAAEGQVLRRAADGLWKNHTLTPGDVGAQPLDTDLTAIAALTTAAFGRGLLTAADAAAARTAIGAGTSNVAISTATPQAPGTPAAGTTGQAADAGHVHALPSLIATAPLAYDAPNQTISLLNIGDGMVLVISNKGETATAGTNYAEVPVPVPSGSFTLTAVRFGSHIDNTGSSSSTFNAYKRTAAGTKTSVLTGNATLAASASLVDVSGTITGGTFAAGDRVGVDLLGVGTGAQGLFAQFIFTRSPV
jgi:hypothetical protein